MSSAYRYRRYWILTVIPRTPLEVNTSSWKKPKAPHSVMFGFSYPEQVSVISLGKWWTSNRNLRHVDSLTMGAFTTQRMP